MTRKMKLIYRTVRLDSNSAPRTSYQAEKGNGGGCVFCATCWVDNEGAQSIRVKEMKEIEQKQFAVIKKTESAQSQRF